jgi:hypothetical protein
MLPKIAKMRKRGRPAGSKKWTPDRDIALVADILRHREGAEGLSASNILRRIANERNVNAYPSFHALRKRAPVAVKTVAITHSKLKRAAAKYNKAKADLAKLKQNGGASVEQLVKIAQVLLASLLTQTETLFSPWVIPYMPRLNGQEQQNVSELFERFPKAASELLSHIPTSPLKRRLEQRLKRQIVHVRGIAGKYSTNS